MKIFLTKRAISSYLSIKEHITYDWGAKVANAFEQKTTDFLEILENYPEIGTIEVKEKQIRGFQLSKQTKVFYRIKGNTIILLTFFDVRQNPTKKPK